MYLKLDGSQIFYEVHGQGYPCIITHGGLGLDHTYFKPYLKELEKTLRLVYYDQRGNGRSPMTILEGLDHQVLAEDVERLREFLHLERPLIMGHSYGGYITLEYAIRHPTRLAGLILVSTAPSARFGHEREMMVIKKATSEQLQTLRLIGSGRIQSSDEFAAAFRKVLPLYLSRQDQGLMEELVRDVMFNFKTASYADHNLLPKYDLTSRLEVLRNLPVLVIAGKDDLITPPSQSKLLHSLLPGSELHLMNRAGHFPFAEDPDQFKKIVADWTARVLQGTTLDG